MSDAFHPHLTGPAHPAGSAHPAGPAHPDGPARTPRLHHVVPAALTGDTAQTRGMTRVEAISGKTVGSEKLWMGQTHVSADTASDNHHHGESETAIYVVRGNPVFVFFDDETGAEKRLETKPGDYIFVPPWVPHREENPDPDNEAVVVISRTTQEAIVVNVASLHPQA